MSRRAAQTDGEAAAEGAAIDKANSVRLERPNGRPRLKRRTGPLGSDRELRKIVYPLTPKIAKPVMPSWLEDALK